MSNQQGDALTSPEPSALPDGWRGPIANLDVPTSDRRMAATPPGGVKTRAYPLTLTRNHVGDPTGYPTIGSVDHVWTDTETGLLMGEGRFDLGGQDGQDAARHLATGMLNRVSIDPVEVVGERRVFSPDHVQLDTPEGGWTEELFDALPEGHYPVTTFADWTLAGLAMVPIPAYTEAAITPVYGYTPTQALPSSAIVSAAIPQNMKTGGSYKVGIVQPDFSDHSMVALRPARPNSFAVKNGSPASSLHVTLGYLGQGALPEHVQAAGHRAAQAAALALHGDHHATVAGYGHIGDPSNPSTALFLNGPGIQAAHQAAMSELEGYGSDIPAQHSPFTAHMTLGYGVPLADARNYVGRKFALKGASFDHQNVTTNYAKPSEAVVAAAMGGQVFNPDFFQDPNLDGPTPLRVTEEGHIYGHVRLSGTCFQYGGDKAKKGLCVQPPPTACNYAKFMVHTAKMSDGSYKPVGALTYGSGHESRGSLYASRAHYDDVSTMAAKVIAGEDEWGTWISGEVLSSVADRAYDLLLSPLSGHWEPDPDNRGHLEMMAAHIVVTPGYAVRHIVAGFGEDGETTSLIVTTWLPAEPIVASTQEEIAVTETPSSRATVVAALNDLQRAALAAHRMGVNEHREARRTAKLARTAELITQFAGSGGGIADPGTPWDGAAAEASVWAHGKNGKIDRGLASKVFLAHTGDGSKKGDWHLPVGRVVGGSVEIVPRGVSAAASRVGQTQGIDQAAAKSKIVGLYSRIHAKYPAWPASPDA